MPKVCFALPAVISIQTHKIVNLPEDQIRILAEYAIDHDWTASKHAYRWSIYNPLKILDNSLSTLNSIENRTKIPILDYPAAESGKIPQRSPEILKNPRRPGITQQQTSQTRPLDANITLQAPCISRNLNQMPYQILERQLRESDAALHMMQYIQRDPGFQAERDSGFQAEFQPGSNYSNVDFKNQPHIADAVFQQINSEQSWNKVQGLNHNFTSDWRQHFGTAVSGISGSHSNLVSEQMLPRFSDTPSAYRTSLQQDREFNETLSQRQLPLDDTCFPRRISGNKIVTNELPAKLQEYASVNQSRPLHTSNPVNTRARRKSSERAAGLRMTDARKQSRKKPEKKTRWSARTRSFKNTLSQSSKASSLELVPSVAASYGDDESRSQLSTRQLNPSLYSSISNSSHNILAPDSDLGDANEDLNPIDADDRHSKEQSVHESVIGQPSIYSHMTNFTNLANFEKLGPESC